MPEFVTFKHGSGRLVTTTKEYAEATGVTVVKDAPAVNSTGQPLPAREPVKSSATKAEK